MCNTSSMMSEAFLDFFYISTIFYLWLNILQQPHLFNFPPCVFIDSWYFISKSLVKTLLKVMWIFVVVIFVYIKILPLTPVLWRVSIFLTNCAGTFVLFLEMNHFILFLEIICFCSYVYPGVLRYKIVDNSLNN